MPPEIRDGFRQVAGTESESLHLSVRLHVHHRDWEVGEQVTLVHEQPLHHLLPIAIAFLQALPRRRRTRTTSTMAAGSGGGCVDPNGALHDEQHVIERVSFSDDESVLCV